MNSQDTVNNDYFYYVDPSYIGSHSDGLKSTPWRNIGDNQWKIINSMLLSNNVTIFFSARQATVDIDEDYRNGFEIKRNAVSNYRLTLNGRSRYNKNDTIGSWENNNGNSRTIFNGNSYGIACWQAGGKQNYVTIDGFKVNYNGTTGSRFGIYYYGGDHVQIINNIVNPGSIYFEYAHYASTHTTNGGCHNITISGNNVSNPLGEGIYFGGNGNYAGNDHNGHTDIIISENIVFNCGTTTGQGDGIDIKDEQINLVVTHNTSYSNGSIVSPGHGIVSLSPGLFERNICYNNTNTGIAFDSYWGNSWTANIIIRNNVVFGNRESGIIVNKSNANINGMAYILNNSLFNNSTADSSSYGIYVYGVPSLLLVNNISFYSFNSSGIECRLSSINSIIEKYNNFFGKTSGFVRDTSDLNTNPMFTSSTNLKLQTGSPCINAGDPNSTSFNFTNDIDGNNRPINSRWDMGAYEQN